MQHSAIATSPSPDADIDLEAAARRITELVYYLFSVLKAAWPEPAPASLSVAQHLRTTLGDTPQPYVTPPTVAQMIEAELRKPQEPPYPLVGLINKLNEADPSVLARLLAPPPDPLAGFELVGATRLLPGR